MLEFNQLKPGLDNKNVLMCIIMALAQTFGNPPTRTIPDSSNFYYGTAFIHIEDFDPSPGRMHTYADMVTTLRGVGEWMTESQSFATTRFWIYDASSFDWVKIGLGAVGSNPTAHDASGPPRKLGPPMDTS